MDARVHNYLMGCLVDSPPVLAATSDTPEDTWEWLPTLGPFSGDGEWSDLSSYVLSCSHARSWNYDTGRFDATATIVICADSRIFDQDNTSGPFYPWLQPGKQIRNMKTWNGTCYAQWRGHITGFSATVPTADNMFITTITARGAFVALQQAKLTRGPYETQVRALRPNIYYRFDDAGRLTDSSGNDRHGSWSQAPTLVNGLLEYDDSMAWGVTEESPMWARGTHTLTFSVVGWSMDMLIKPTSGTLWMAKANNIVYIAYMVAGKLRMWNSGTSFYRETANALNDGATYHVYYDSTTDHFSINGVEETGTTAGGTPSQYTGGLNNGEIILCDSASGNDPYVGTLDEVAFYTTAVASNYNTATQPWVGDDTGTRIGRILDLIGWPSTLRTISTGVSTMQPFEYTSGMSALDAINQAIDTELGLTYIGKDGKFVHEARSALFAVAAHATSQATYGDRGVTLLYDADGFEMGKDHALIRNPVSASRNDGATVTAEDSALSDPNVNGNRGWNAPTAYDRYDAVMRDRATYLMGRYKSAKTRVRSGKFGPRRDASNLWPSILTRELGDKTTWKRTPLNTGTQISADQWVDSIECSAGRRDWRYTFSGIPVDTSNYAVYDDGTIYDDGTVYAY